MRTWPEESAGADGSFSHDLGTPRKIESTEADSNQLAGVFTSMILGLEEVMG